MEETYSNRVYTMKDFMKKFRTQRKGTNIAHTNTLPYTLSFKQHHFIGISLFLSLLVVVTIFLFKKRKSNNVHIHKQDNLTAILPHQQRPVTPEKNNLEGRNTRLPPKVAKKPKRPPQSEESRKRVKRMNIKAQTRILNDDRKAVVYPLGLRDFTAEVVGECPVCLEEVQAGMIWVRLKCDDRHSICKTCANRMFKEMFSKCPVCRGEQY